MVTPDRLPARSFALLAIICFAWSLNVIVSKIVVDQLQVPPLFYAAARSLLVLAVLLPFLRPVPEKWGQALLFGLAISGGSFALLFVGLREASPSSAAIVSLSGAPLTVLFAIALLGEKVGWRRAMGILLTFIGVVVAVASPSGWQSSTGLLFIGASAIVGALGTVLIKRLEISALGLQAWAALASVLVLVPLSAALEADPLPAVAAAPLAFFACLLFSALVVSVGAHTLYFRLLQRHDANLIAPLTLMTPLWTIALGAAITGDTIGPALLTGGALAIAGVLVILLRPSRTFAKAMLVRTRL